MNDVPTFFVPRSHSFHFSFNFQPKVEQLRVEQQKFEPDFTKIIHPLGPRKSRNSVWKNGDESNECSSQ